jgi:hypothetical protein
MGLPTRRQVNPPPPSLKPPNLSATPFVERIELGLNALAAPAFSLVPPVGVLGVARALDSNNTKPLTGGRLHDYPSFETLDHRCSQLLEARHLSRNVVRLNVEVYATFVLYTLDLNNRLVRRSFEHAVVAACAWVLAINRTAERRGPERRCLIYIRSVAVDQDCAKPRVVRHDSPNLRRFSCATTPESSRAAKRPQLQ